MDANITPAKLRRIFTAARSLLSSFALVAALFLTGCGESTSSSPGSPSEGGAGSGSGSGAPPAADEKKSPQVTSLLGKWKGVNVWDGNEQRPSGEAKSMLLEFKRDTFEIRQGGETLVGNYRVVDAQSSPGRLQLITGAGADATTINVVFEVSRKNLAFSHSVSNFSQWPREVGRGADVYYGEFVRD